MAEYTRDIAFVIFDCDGVLIDSEVLSMKVWAGLLQEHGVHIDQQYFFEHFLGRSFEHVQSVISKDFNLAVDTAMANRFADELKATFEQQLSPTDGINEVLSSLKVPYCLATSSSRERTRIALNATGLNRYFSEAQIFTAADVTHGKPAPDLFLYAAKQQGISPSHCLVIEDSAPGLQAAKAAEMHYLHYVGGAHMSQTAEKRENALAHWRVFNTHYPYLINQQGKKMASTPTNENQKLEDAARAGWLYYVAGKTQDEIAKQLNTSRQSAQRLVALAVSQGLIKVRLEHPIRHCMELADALQRQYGLAQCEVVPSVSDDPNSTIGLAQAGAAEIERHLKHRQSKIIAFGTGRVLRACADELPALQCPQHRIVSLVGNIAQDGSASRYDVAIHVAERIGARHFPMPVPVIAGSEADKAHWQQLTHVNNVKNLADQADVAFVGIGNLGTKSPLHIDGFIAQHELAALDAMGAAGEVISWIYDSDGKLVDSEINRRVTSASLAPKDGKVVIGIAAGQEKVSAISGALESAMINGLITNEFTAEALLKR